MESTVINQENVGEYPDCCLLLKNLKISKYDKYCSM